MAMDRVLVDLGVISQLQESDKLGVLNLPGKQHLVIHSGRMWFQGVYRWYDRANRGDVLEYLNDLVSRIEKHCEVFSEPVTAKTKVYRASLKRSILSALAGLAHLRNTYAIDSHVVARLALVTAKLAECSKQIMTAEEEDDGHPGV